MPNVHACSVSSELAAHQCFLHPLLLRTAVTRSCSYTVARLPSSEHCSHLPMSETILAVVWSAQVLPVLANLSSMRETTAALTKPVTVMLMLVATLLLKHRTVRQASKEHCSLFCRWNGFTASQDASFASVYGGKSLPCAARHVQCHARS